MSILHVLACRLGPTEVQCTSTDRGTCVCGECQCRRDQAVSQPLFYLFITIVNACRVPCSLGLLVSATVMAVPPPMESCALQGECVRALGVDAM